MPFPFSSFTFAFIGCRQIPRPPSQRPSSPSPPPPPPPPPSSSSLSVTVTLHLSLAAAPLCSQTNCVPLRPPLCSTFLHPAPLRRGRQGANTCAPSHVVCITFHISVHSESHEPLLAHAPGGHQLPEPQNFFLTLSSSEPVFFSPVFPITMHSGCCCAL